MVGDCMYRFREARVGRFLGCRQSSLAENQQTVSCGSHELHTVKPLLAVTSIKQPTVL